MTDYEMNQYTSYVKEKAHTDTQNQHWLVAYAVIVGLGGIAKAIFKLAAVIEDKRFHS